MYSVRNAAFTIVELLVVIAVIGIIATGIVIAINPAAQLAKARDSARKAAVIQLKKQLDSYYLYHNTYPFAQWANSTQGSSWIPGLLNSGDAARIPVDPINSQTGGLPWSNGSNYAIYYLSDNWYDGSGGPNCGANPTNHYIITVHLENPADPLMSNQVNIGNASPGCTFSLGGWFSLSPQSNP